MNGLVRVSCLDPSQSDPPGGHRPGRPRWGLQGFLGACEDGAGGHWPAWGWPRIGHRLAAPGAPGGSIAFFFCEDFFGNRFCPLQCDSLCVLVPKSGKSQGFWDLGSQLLTSRDWRLSWGKSSHRLQHAPYLHPKQLWGERPCNGADFSKRSTWNGQLPKFHM